MIPVDREAMAWVVRRRLAVALVVGMLVMLLLLLRSWYLQVLHHDQYKVLAQNNRMRVVAQKPERGLIYDHGGRLLVANVPSFDLALVLDDVPNLTETVATLADLLDLDQDRMLEAARRQRRNIPYLPVTIHENLTFKEVSTVEWARLQGVVVLGEAKRHYVYGKTAGHLLGYVGEVTESQLGDKRYANVLPGTRVGQYGAEAMYDDVLRGVPGERRIEVDAKGFEVREISRIPPVGGNELYLSLDIKVQQAAEKALAGRPGAVVAIDPRNGRVIALVSAPAVNPEEISRGVSPARWKEITSNPEKPLLNRAVQGVYPPGSVFKIPVAAAMLETDGDHQGFFCTGKHPFMGRTYRDWKKEGHGSIGLHDAIVQSCDVFFYEYGHQMGIDTIAEYAGLFGLGERTGIDLPGERSGIIPSTTWKKAAKGEVWFPGETLSAAIGQGYVSTTPIQVAVLMAVVGEKGARYVPTIHLGEWSQGEDGITLSKPRALPGAELSKRTYNILNRALKGVVREGRGTGRAAYSKLTTVAGKTGTAQVVSLAEDEERKEQKDIKRRLRDHAWFAAYAPADDPTIAVAVLVEHGGHGGGVAGPIARAVIESHMRSKGRLLTDDELAKKLNAIRKAREES